MPDVVALLEAWSRGERDAFDALVPLVYADLRRLARAQLSRERADPVLQTTALVHEAYVKLVDQRRATLKSRDHFLAVAARVMRRILVDRARNRRAAKRGHGAAPVTLTDNAAAAHSVPIDVMDLDRLLERLAALDHRQAQIVELRYFAGLSIEDTAAVIDASPMTVKREWRHARAWLFRELTASPGKLHDS
jgi:RNA polymerase sigma factor (TIGR02999 family)